MLGMAGPWRGWGEGGGATKTNARNRKACQFGIQRLGERLAFSMLSAPETVFSTIARSRDGRFLFQEVFVTKFEPFVTNSLSLNLNGGTLGSDLIRRRISGSKTSDMNYQIFYILFFFSIRLSFTCFDTL